MNKKIVVKTIWISLVLLISIFILNNNSFKTDITQFLPAGVDKESSLLMKLLQDGPGSRVIIAEFSGENKDELASVAKYMSVELSKTGKFQKILGTEISIPDIDDDILFRYRFLLTDTDFSVKNIKSELSKRLEELSYGLIVDRKQFKRDPVNVYLSYLKSLSSINSRYTYKGVWFSEDKKNSYLLLYSSSSSLDLISQEKVINSIYKSFGIYENKNIKIKLTGPPVFAVYSKSAIQKTSQFISLISSIGIVILIYFSYRSFRRVFLISIPLLSGILSGTSVVLLLFGQIHAITLAFGITILGIAIDYPIHLYSHGGTRSAAKQIRRTLALSAITTSIGFIALLLSGFDGLQQMGVFAIFGVITAAFVTHWVLPEFESREIYLQALYDVHVKNIILILNKIKVIDAFKVLTLISIIFFLFNYPNLWEKGIKKISPVPEQLINLDEQIRSRINAPEPGEFLLISGRSQEQVLQKSEEIVPDLEDLIKKSLLKSFDAPSLYLPSKSRQAKRQENLPLKSSIEDIVKQAQDNLPFQNQLFVPFINDIVTSKKLPLLDFSKIKDTLLEMRVSSLLIDDVNEWHAVIPLDNVSKIADIENFAKIHDAQYINTANKISDMMGIYLNNALVSMSYGLCFILIIIILVFRSIKKVTMIVLPVISVIFMTVGCLALIIGNLNIFHVISLLVVLGISLDYFLYVDRFKSNASGYKTIGSSLLMCSMTTLLVFFILSITSIPVLQAIGQTISIGTFFSLVLSLAYIGAIDQNKTHI